MSQHNTEAKIFAGNSNPPLAREITDYLQVPLGKASVETFSEGESKVEIKENVRGADVFVLQSTSAPGNDNLMELLLMLDAFKRASAKRITAVIPYYGYARQDRKVAPRVPISAKLVADLITTAGASSGHAPSRSASTPTSPSSTSGGSARTWSPRCRSSATSTGAWR